jgi:hypothetical protein
MFQKLIFANLFNFVSFTAKNFEDISKIHFHKYFNFVKSVGKLCANSVQSEQEKGS